MKLLRYGPKGQEKPGTLDAEGRIRDLSGVVADITPNQLWGEGLAALTRQRAGAGLREDEVGVEQQGPAVGLAGERLTDGLVGQWVQPYWLWLNAREAGGRLDVEVEEGRVVLTAVLPG